MSYEGKRFCGHEGVYMAGGTLCRFPGAVLRWTADGSLPNFDALTIKQIGHDAWKAITDVCGLVTEYTSNPKTADVVTQFGRIDGKFGILAQSEIWCGARQTPAGQLFDTSEDFVYSYNPPVNRISLTGTWTHENIHAAGLNGHIGPGNLMASTYDSRFLVPQAGDIAELVARYGLPKPPAPDMPPAIPAQPPVPGLPGFPFDEISVVIQGVRYTYKPQA